MAQNFHESWNAQPNTNPNPAGGPNPYNSSGIYDSFSSKSNAQSNMANPKQQPQKPKPSFGQQISIFFRNVGIAAILVAIGVSSLFAYIIINPDSDVSRFVVENTPLQSVFTLSNGENEDNAEQTEPANETEAKLGNQIFGLEPLPNNAENQNPARVVQNVIQSVISINTRIEGSSTIFSGSTASGTGIIISDDGLVLTNRHVVSQACTPQANNLVITAQDNEQRAFELKLLSLDPIDDIALLQIQNPPENLQPVVFGDSDDLVLGEQVIAIGNVLGELQNTVTEGIISGLDRNLRVTQPDPCLRTSTISDGLIQTDAAINRGNSGGPLFNSAGQMIGMNTFGTTDAQNIGFAIPSSIIVSSLESYRENGTITRPRLGVLSLPITPLLKEENTWIPAENGEILFASEGQEAVTPGSAAAEAGLRNGDIILAIDDTDIKYTQANPSPLRRELLKYQAGDTITLTVLKVETFANENSVYQREAAEVKVTLGGITVEDILQ